MKGKYTEVILISASAAALAVLLLTRPEGLLRICLYSALYIIIACRVLFGAAADILKGKLFDERFLMSIATIGAFAVGSYAEGVAVMIFYRAGELLTDLASDRSRSKVLTLLDMRGDSATLVTGDGERTVSPQEVRVGDLIAVKAGERIPLDGEITEGAGELDTSSLTGESLPREVGIGDAVQSGCVNLSSALRLRVTHEYGSGTVAKILKLVETASEKKAKTEKFITSFSRIYTPVVVGCALLTAVIPPLLFAQSWNEWIYRALTFLVISCPCAVVMSVPLAFFCGCGRAARKGVLIKGGTSMEQLARVKTVFFDKTGTLTKGRFEVTDIHPVGTGKRTLIELAAKAEYASVHPIAQALREAYGEQTDAAEIEAATVLHGYGVRARVGGAHVLVGNAKLMREQNIEVSDEKSQGTQVYVSCDGRYLGSITVSDVIRDDAAAAIESLRKTGVDDIVMLSGDAEATVGSVAESMGITSAYGSLLPADKVELLTQHPKRGATAFVGDGVNDAPAIAAADVGIAMGALGSDAAIEAADVVLMGEELGGVPLAIKTARLTKRTASQNIVFSLAVKAVVLALGALGYAPMWLAVTADVGVSLLAVLNSLRAA